MTSIAILGGGIIGLLSALFTKNIVPHADINIIEASNRMGGLLKPLIASGVPVDQGVHTFYETGIKEVDNLIFSIEPEGGWNILKGHQRDIGGSINETGLSLGNHYLRSIEYFSGEKSAFEVFKDEHKQNLDEADLIAWLNSRYGKTLASRIIKPYVEKYANDSWETVGMGVRGILPIERLNVADELEFATSVVNNDLFRSRIAIPDQRELEMKYLPQRKAYYPSQYGSYRYIDSILGNLAKSGVSLSTGTKAKITKPLKLLSESTENSRPYDLIVSTLSLPATYALLGIKPNIQKKQNRTVIASVITAECPDVADLYYAYDHRDRTRLFRLGFPHNYSKNRPFANKYLISCEYICNAQKELTQSEVIGDLESVVLHDSRSVSQVDIQEIEGGYPIATRELENFLRENAKTFDDLSAFHNVLHLGIGSGNGLFRQHDLIANAFLKLNQVLKDSK
jgi:protoporphyrinogen oxidase